MRFPTAFDVKVAAGAPAKVANPADTAVTPPANEPVVNAGAFPTNVVFEGFSTHEIAPLLASVAVAFGLLNWIDVAEMNFVIGNTPLFAGLAAPEIIISRLTEPIVNPVPPVRVTIPPDAVSVAAAPLPIAALAVSAHITIIPFKVVKTA